MENPYLFKQGQIVRHLNTGGEYVIVGTPDVFRLEADRKPAYAYRSTDPTKPEVWVREQSEMEDGRFKTLG